MTKVRFENKSEHKIRAEDGSVKVVGSRALTGLVNSLFRKGIVSRDPETGKKVVDTDDLQKVVDGTVKVRMVGEGGKRAIRGFLDGLSTVGEKKG